MQLNADNQLFAEAVHTKNHLVSSYSPAPYTLTMSYPASGRFYPTSVTLPKGMTVKKGFKYPDGHVVTAASEVLASDVVVVPTGAITGTWRTVAGGGRTDITDDTMDRVLVGAKGSIAGWDYEDRVHHVQERGHDFLRPGQFSYAKLTPLVASGEINVFGSQDAASQAALEGARWRAWSRGPPPSRPRSTSRLRESCSSRRRPVGFALGASVRKEKLDQMSDEVLATGDEVGGGGPIPTVTGDRKVYGFFAETEIR